MSEWQQVSAGVAQTAHPAAFFPQLIPLMARLVADCGAAEIGVAEYENFVCGAGDALLFFSGDPQRYPESLDVAAILPELSKAFPNRLRIGLVRQDAEIALQTKFGFNVWPTLIFMRDGAYIGTLSGMRDWDEYLREVQVLFATPPSRPPTVGIGLALQGQAQSVCNA